MINVMCIFIFVNWDTLVPWAYQLCCLPSINNTIQYSINLGILRFRLVPQTRYYVTL